jgi:DNA-binding NarL/FixJ family response regulator
VTLQCVIVDDSPDVRRGASELLRSQGIAVVGVAASGDEAMDLMEHLQPDVLLIDVVLGRESGFDVVRRLVARDHLCGSRTILTSTYEEADFAQRIAASPAIGFLPKSQLSAAAIHSLLARARN